MDSSIVSFRVTLKHQMIRPTSINMLEAVGMEELPLARAYSKRCRQSRCRGFCCNSLFEEHFLADRRLQQGVLPDHEATIRRNALDDVAL